MNSTSAAVERERDREREKENGEREKESRAEHSESMMKGVGGSVCARVCVHVSARVCLINAVSIRRREWEGEKNTGYSYRRRQRLGRARSRGGREGRVETERKSFEDSTSRERQLG